MQKYWIGIACPLLFAAALPAFAGGIGVETDAGSGLPGGALFGGAVSVMQAQQLQGLLGGIEPGATGLSPTLLESLKTLDVNLPANRALLAPIQAAAGGGKPDEHSVHRALRLINERMKASMGGAIALGASGDEVKKSADDLDSLHAIVQLYRPEQLAKLETAARIAHKRYVEMEKAQAESTIRGGAAAMATKIGDAVGLSPSSSQQGKKSQVEQATRLIREIHAMDAAAASVEKFPTVLKMVRRSRDEGVQRVLVRGLLEDMARKNEVGYAKKTIGILLAISEAATTDNIRQIEIEGIAAEIQRIKKHDDSGMSFAFFRTSNGAIRDIAAAAESNRIRGIALKLIDDELAPFKAGLESNDYYRYVLEQHRVDIKASYRAGADDKVPAPHPESPKTNSALPYSWSIISGNPDVRTPQ